MAQVRTVTGLIDSSALRHTQPHEHLWVAPSPGVELPSELIICDERKSTAELISYRCAGGATVIDAQPGGAGRNIQALRRMSIASGVNIIAVTGYHEPLFYPESHFILNATEVELAEHFISELRLGCADEIGCEPVFPGAVKAAIGKDGLTGHNETRLRAAALAAAECGVPLILHTWSGAGAVEAIKICCGRGLKAARIAVCHVDRQAIDYATHEAVAATGCYLEYDTINRLKYHDDEQELALIRHMVGLGYQRQLMISLDTTAVRLCEYGADFGLTYIIDVFMTRLKQTGISETDIALMTAGNPARLFE